MRRRTSAASTPRGSRPPRRSACSWRCCWCSASAPRMGEADIRGDWGWRIPFLLSAVLLAVSIWIRLKLNESPLFQKMKEEGKGSKRPLSEAFGEWANAKIAILALLGATAGEAVVWYGGQFYALFFLTQTLKVPAVNAQIMIAVALAARHAVLHRVRLAVRQDRPQADHPGRLRAGGGDLLPDLPGHHPLRQSEAGSGARLGAGDSHRRSDASARSSSTRSASRSSPPRATSPNRRWWPVR